MGANAGPDVRVCRLLHHNATAFAIDASTGCLNPLNQQETGGTNGVHLAVDPSNRFLVVSNYSGSLPSLRLAYRFENK